MNSEFGIRNSEFGISIAPAGSAKSLNTAKNIQNSNIKTQDACDGCDEIQNSKLKIQNSTEGGYTLVVVVMIVAVMAIMMAVAVQIVSFQMKREREAELIFRGEQYVEAIRLYKQKYGRNPMQMKELWEADPRVLRQKWTDPITGSDKWGLVFMGQEGYVSPTGKKPRHEVVPTPTRTPVFGDREGAFGERTGEKIGPIMGVHSLSTDESIKIYEGRTRYNEWLFVLKEQGGGAQPGGGGGDNPRGQPPTPIPGQSPNPPPRRTGTPGY